MRKLLILILLVLGAVSCRRANPVMPEEEGKKPELPPARITDTIRYEDDKCTAYNIEYPSRDPYGDPVTLSGAIVIGDEITTETPAKGIFLYNHFTSYGEDECPSHGDLGVQKIMTGSGLIIVSSDFYGFGVTGDKPQAYGLADSNGEASVDALLAAFELLPEIGYSWDNVIFNLGYSQGAQIAVAALKVATMKHPEFRFTQTFAGGGLYDVSATYRSLATSGSARMPHAVVSVILAYNEFYKLGFPMEALFKEPFASDIPQWFLSREYTRNEVANMLGNHTLEDIVTKEVMNVESDISKQLFAAMDQENLCRGWAPWLNEKIFLVHNKADDVVPVENTLNLVRFLENHGLTVNSRVDNYLEIPGILPPHYMGAVPFLTGALNDICTTLGICLWIDPSMVVQFFRDAMP